MLLSSLHWLSNSNRLAAFATGSPSCWELFLLQKNPVRSAGFVVLKLVQLKQFALLGRENLKMAGVQTCIRIVATVNSTEKT